MRSSAVSGFSRMLILILLSTPVFAQTDPPAMEAVTLDEAVQRALANNPTIGQAAQGILRAEALLQQTRSGTLPNVHASFTNVLVNAERSFDDTVTQPRNQSTLAASLSMPVLAASQWAATTQARDQVEIAGLSAADVRTNIAVATAQAYLAIIAQKRQVDVGLRARETATAHLDYARRRLEAGAGTRLNELRAGQEVATDEARLDTFRLGVRIAQEALGVLMVANGPVDAVAEPVLEIPAAIDEPSWMAARPDVRLFAASERAADRVFRDSYKDYFPTGVVSFEPQMLAPASVFTSSKSWRFVVSFTQPVFDGGLRKGQKRLRESSLNISRLELQGLQIQARAEVRIATETLRSAERVLVSLRSAVQQANDVLSIVTVAFEAGATTNLEVIDAQRQARDAETSAAVAENVMLRARLSLLTALGRFPQ